LLFFITIELYSTKRKSYQKLELNNINTKYIFKPIYKNEKIGLFYSYNTKKTAQIANRIIENFEAGTIEAVNAEEITEEQFMKYDNLILGVPTWFDGELPNYWDEFVPALEDLNLKNKKVAIFGAGDQKGYPENFVDGIGIMAGILEQQGAKIVGFTSVKGYEFESSKARRGDQFCGLALDFENQSGMNKNVLLNGVNNLKRI
jgi:flavodoxin I